MGKIYANHISDKGLGSGIYKELLPPYSPPKRQILQFSKWAKDVNKYFFKQKNTDDQQANEKILNIIYP